MELNIQYYLLRQQNIKFEKDGNTWYVPLVSGTACGYATENGNGFKLGYLKIGDKYGAVEANGVHEIIIEHYPNALYDRLTVQFQEFLLIMDLKVIAVEMEFHTLINVL